MDMRFLVLLFSVILSTSGCQREERNVAKQAEAAKSGEKIKLIIPTRDVQYVTCSSPRYKCCEKAPGVQSESNTCLREDNSVGICCNPQDVKDSPFGIFDVTLENGTQFKAITNKLKEEFEEAVSKVAQVVEKNEKLRETDEKAEATGSTEKPAEI